MALESKVACLGPDRKFYHGTDDTFKCILCFENCAISRGGRQLVSSAFVQTSRVIFTTPNLRNSQSALHISCCGHVMHYSCWLEYFTNEEFKELRRPHRNRAALAQAANVEFQCPYCRTLSNAIIPVTETLPAFSAPPSPNESYLPLDSFVEIMSTLAIELGNVKDHELTTLPSVSNILRLSGVVGGLAQFERSVQLIKNPPRLHADYIEGIEFLKKALLNTMKIQQSHLKDHPAIESIEMVPILWDSCSYTLQALEIYLYAVEKPLKAELSMRHQSCARNLVRLAHAVRPWNGKLIFHCFRRCVPRRSFPLDCWIQSSIKMTPVCSSGTASAC